MFKEIPASVHMEIRLTYRQCHPGNIYDILSQIWSAIRKNREKLKTISVRTKFATYITIMDIIRHT